jgi:hypothetical protein
MVMCMWFVSQGFWSPLLDAAARGDIARVDSLSAAKGFDVNEAAKEVWEWGAHAPTPHFLCYRRIISHSPLVHHTRLCHTAGTLCAHTLRRSCTVLSVLPSPSLPPCPAWLERVSNHVVLWCGAACSSCGPRCPWPLSASGC